MRKEEIRKEFFKLKIKGHSYSQCRKLILAQYGYEVTARTLQRWERKLRTTDWDLMDNSRRPKNIHYKINSEIEEEIILIRNKTGWGADKINTKINQLSTTFIKRIL